MSTRRSTRSATSKSPAKSNMSASGRKVNSKKKQASPESVAESSDDDGGDGEGDAYEDPEEEKADLSGEDSQEDLDSDALDEFEDQPSNKKRKRGSPNKAKSHAKLSPTKKLKAEDTQFDEDGFEVVGEIVQAPTTGQVPPGQISRNTFKFLKDLQDPEKNDRTWFKLHGWSGTLRNSLQLLTNSFQEPVYRQAEKEFKDFIDAFTSVLVKADSQVPHLPAKDVIHRIYRDVRFSNDKTPYKRNLSASFSRSGRKGIFAGYHLSLKPGDTWFAAGTWCPGKDELATIRHNILHSADRLREIISSAEFTSLFGAAKPHSSGKRQNVFGMEDQLKVAPKGVDKNHKDIDLLKLRSFAVSCRFEDKDVLSADFKEKVGEMVKATREFVHCLNDMMTIPPDEEEEEN